MGEIDSGRRFRHPTLRSVAAATADFWVAWLCLSAGLEQLAGGPGPEFLFAYLLGLEGLALFVERWLILGLRPDLSGTSRGRPSLLKAAAAGGGLVATAILASVWLSMSLIALLLMMVFAPRDALVVLIVVGRRVWWGWTNRPRTDEELAQRRAWWRLERRVHWGAFAVAAAVGVLGSLGGYLVPGAPQGEAIPWLGLSLYFATLAVYVLFRDPAAEGREAGSGYVSSSPGRPALTPFEPMALGADFRRHYLSLLPGILSAAATSHILLAAPPPDARPVVWPVAYALGAIVLVAGAVRALGMTEAPLLRFAFMRSRDTLARVLGLWLLALLLIPFAAWVAMVLAGGQPDAPGHTERALLILPALLIVAGYPLVRLWPSLFSAYIYRGSHQRIGGRLRDSTPGFRAAWHMTAGYLAWRHATGPLLLTALLVNGPLVWVLAEAEGGFVRLVCTVLLYAVTIPFTLYVAVERAAALRLETLDGIEEVEALEEL